MKGGTAMYSKFFQLEPEKQTRIINAAIKVFSQKRYKDASTDEIIKEAGISKGSLFHYFKNKKDLYSYLCEYVMKVLVDEFYSAVDLSERDFLQRWKQVFAIKLAIYKKYPDMTNFTRNIMIEEDENIKNDFGIKSQEITNEFYTIMLKDLDTTGFREDVDVEKSINVIIWTLESYSQKQQALLRLDNINSEFYFNAIAELDGYIDLFKKCFYKGGNEL